MAQFKKLQYILILLCIYAPCVTNAKIYTPLQTHLYPEFTPYNYTNTKFTSHIQNYPTHIQPHDFLHTIQNLTKKYKQELKQKKYWQNAYERNIEIKNKTASLGFIGDLHGALPTLMRQLELLKNVSTLFLLGDYTNRGPYGVEVWYTLAQLKLNNWNKVFLLKGNHENITVNELGPHSGGFILEIKKKFGEKAKKIILAMKELYTCLPLNINLNFNGKKIGIRHGGINPLEPIYKINYKKKFQKINTKKQYKGYYGHEGYNCGHFTCNNTLKKINYGVRKIAITPDTASGYGFIAGRKGTKQYLKERDLDFIVHGHQHDSIGPWILNECSTKLIYLKHKTHRTIKKRDLVITICSCPTDFGFDYEASAVIKIQNGKLALTINKTNLPQNRYGIFLKKI